MKTLALFALATLAVFATPAAAQTSSAQNARIPAKPMAATTPTGAKPRTILFVGNSFTHGAHSAVRNYRPDLVHDLNHGGYGGVPALFKQFTMQAGLNYDVSLETQGGKPLRFHYEERLPLLDHAWDNVILQDLSTFSRKNPGDPTDHIMYTGLLSAMFRKANPAVLIDIDATWSRADETYLPNGHWYGKPITAMAIDLRAAADQALRASPNIRSVIPVGEAFNRAFTTNVADPNPYDGTTYGQVDLWTYDQDHASIYGYYLEALVIFGHITGVDPRTLGATEQAGDALGISPEQVRALEQVAYDTLRHQH
jgi:hypothetical protein